MGLYDTAVNPFAAPRSKTPTTAKPTSEPGTEPRRQDPLAEQVTDGSGSERIDDELRPLFAPDGLRVIEQTPNGEGKRPPKVSAEAIALCLALRACVQTNTDTYVTPNASRPVKISQGWLVDMDRLLRRDNVAADRVAELIRWTSEDAFWRTNIRSPKKLRDHAPRLLMDQRYLNWRTQQGLAAWPAPVHELCQSMTQLLAALFPGNGERQPEPTWFSGADQLLQKYSLIDVEDMMDWARGHARYRDRIGRLLVLPQLAAEIRENNDFIAWSQQRGRAWASGSAVLPGGRATVRPGAAQRIGATVDDSVFVDYAQTHGLMA